MNNEVNAAVFKFTIQEAKEKIAKTQAEFLASDVNHLREIILDNSLNKFFLSDKNLPSEIRTLMEEWCYPDDEVYLCQKEHDFLIIVLVDRD